MDTLYAPYAHWNIKLSSVVLGQRRYRYCKAPKYDTQNMPQPDAAKQNGLINKNINFKQFYMKIVDALKTCYESTIVDLRSWAISAHGDSLVHQHWLYILTNKLKHKKETSSMNASFKNRLKTKRRNMNYMQFRVLNPHQWSLDKQSIVNLKCDAQ